MLYVQIQIFDEYVGKKPIRLTFFVSCHSNETIPLFPRMVFRILEIICDLRIVLFLQCNNMMLVESIGKEPLCFQVIRFDSQKVNYTIQVGNVSVNSKWVHPPGSPRGLAQEKLPGVVGNSTRAGILHTNG